MVHSGRVWQKDDKLKPHPRNLATQQNLSKFKRGAENGVQSKGYGFNCQSLLPAKNQVYFGLKVCSVWLSDWPYCSGPTAVL